MKHSIIIEVGPKSHNERFSRFNLITIQITSKRSDIKIVEIRLLFINDIRTVYKKTLIINLLRELEII